MPADTTAAASAGDTAFELRPRAPFDLALTVWTLRRQPHNAMDRWQDNAYRRVLAFDTGAVQACVRQTGSRARPRLRVTLHGPTAAQPQTRKQARQCVRRVLGLSADLRDFYALADADPALGYLANRFMGMHPPRYLSLFEALTNALVCQQISLHVGITILNRLCETYGVRAGDGYGFVRPADLLAAADADALRALGLSYAKAHTLLRLASACVDGDLSEARLTRLPDADKLRRLQQIRGIGRWSAEYVLLRGLSRWQFFPGDDVGAQKYLKQWLGLDHAPDYDQVAAALQRWKPCAGLIYFHLLLYRLEQAGLIAG